jgi:hypothetical protein
MTHSAVQNRLAWDDRWSQPSLEQLLHPLKVQPRRLFDQILGKVTGLSNVDRSIIWYGPSWKWTIYYTLPASSLVHLPPISSNGSSAGGASAAASTSAAGKNSEPETLCYLVPNHQNPLICVPLSDAVIDRLPLKRLNRFVREAIASSKCAVSIHWAIFSPTTLAETGYLVDLIERKHAILTGGQGPVLKPESKK